VAVSTSDAALRLYDAGSNLAVVHRETVEAQASEAVLLDVGENHVGCSRRWARHPVGKFLASRGPGLHHVAYQTATSRPSWRG